MGKEKNERKTNFNFLSNHLNIACLEEGEERDAIEDDQSICLTPDKIIYRVVGGKTQNEAQKHSLRFPLRITTHSYIILT